MYTIIFLSWILYINEEERITRHTLACLSAFLPLYHESELVYCHPATTDFNESADDGSYHVSEESVCTYHEHPAAVTQVLPFCLRNLAESGLYICMRLAETSEVLIFKQHFSRFVHLIEIQIEMTLIRIVTLERILGGMNEIVVGSQSGRESGMKIIGNMLYLMNRNVRRKHSVDLVGKLFTIQFAVLAKSIRDRCFREIKMSHHQTRMNAGIRPSCTYDINRCSENGAKATLNFAFHGNAVWLYLPPVKTSSVV